MIQIKRVYEPAGTKDGYRILVDRLWPRGLSKGSAKVDLWLKEVAPSTALRKWFGHDPAKWKQFRARYIEELADQSELVSQLRVLERQHGTITLLYGAKNSDMNQAVVLAGLI